MDGIYFIRNSINEWHSSITGYFKTEDEAREALKSCHDWFMRDGTGEIYFQPFGLRKDVILIDRIK